MSPEFIFMEALRTLPLTPEPSPTPSDSSVEFILDGPCPSLVVTLPLTADLPLHSSDPPVELIDERSSPSLDVSTSSDQNHGYQFPSKPKSGYRHRHRSAMRLLRRRKRLEARLGALEGRIAYEQNRNEIDQLKEDISSLSQKLRMKRKTERAKQTNTTPSESRLGNPEGLTAFVQNRNGTARLTEKVSSIQQWSELEFKRAMVTKLTPDMIQTIEILDDGPEEIDNEVIDSTDYRSTIEDTRPNAFAGKAMIQDRLGAVRQSLSEYTNATQVNNSGRHSFHVDASVSNNMTGLAVVHRTHRQDQALPWTAKGYRIHKRISQNEAEVWAVWKALVSILETIQTNCKNEHSQEPWSAVAIYSDSQHAVAKIGEGSLKNRRLMRKIALISRQLSQIQVEVELHWEPGHRKIPGNELADMVSKKARLPL